MKQADLTELQTKIAALTKASPIGERVRNVSVEESDDEGGGEFLRVLVEMDRLEELELDEVESLLRSIEDTVSSIDERYPSVRFADAA